MVGVERDAEEVAVRADGSARQVAARAAVARHLAVHQLHVEVAELDVVALRRLVATACRTQRRASKHFKMSAALF